ncbi:hypothetical protein PV327_011480, partial [Microctonus hyperodae]
RRDNWTPTNGARLSEKHFEDSRFEKNRQDGWEKLKPNAVPTLFDVRNPPPMIDPPPRKSVYKNTKNESSSNSDVPQSSQLEHQCLLENLEVVEVPEPVSTLVQQEEVSSILKKYDTIPVFSEDSSSIPHNVEANDVRLKGKNENLEIIIEKQQSQMTLLNKTLKDLTSNIVVVEKQNMALLQQISKLREIQKSFLNDALIQKLEVGRVNEWSNEAIIKGPKLRYALGVHGYKYLLSTGYTSPSYPTIMRRIQEYKLHFGIFEDVHKRFG